MPSALDKRPSTRGFLLVVILATGVAVGAAAIGIGQLIKAGIRGEAVSGAETAAVLFGELALQPDEYERGQLTDEAVADLADFASSTAVVDGVRLWSREGTLIFSSGVARSTSDEKAPEELGVALGGETPSSVTAARGNDFVKVSVPIMPSPAARPANVLEVYSDYGPVESVIAGQTRQLYLILAIATVLGLLALLPLLRRVSRALSAGRDPRLRKALDRAMANDELELHYQPKQDLDSGRICGVEALLRWRHPTDGLIPPLEFLPRAEEAGLLGPITLHVLDLALRQSGEWEASGQQLPIAVNLSADNLRDPQLPAMVAELFDQHRVPPSRITLEITETAVMEHESLAVLERLADIGVDLSIDDFGTGHSSLARLDQLPLDELKVDRSFVSKLADGGSETLIASVVRLGHDLGMRIVAEGAESPQAAAQLRALGCDLAQGYYLTKPLGPEDLDRWLGQRSDRELALT